MADITVERKSSGMTAVWAVLAVLAVVAFMFWLYSNAQQMETAAAVAADSAAAAESASSAAPTGEVVDLPALAMAPDSYAGRTLQVDGIPVAATVGPRAFWGDVPGQNPFLVVFGPGVQADGTVASGQTYSVVGTVQPVNETSLNEWVQAGAIGEAQREEASFATHVLLAEQATAGAAAPAAAPAGQ